jgi:hypothetical protein
MASGRVQGSTIGTAPGFGLPAIQLGSLTTSRLISGSNPINGFSHAGAERSARMLDYFTVENIKRYLQNCESAGIDTLIARADSFTMRVLREYWNEGGRIQWIAQTAPEYADPEQYIAAAHRHGAAAIFLHGGQVGRLAARGDFSTLGRLVGSIHSLGLPAGMAAHDPAHLLEAQRLRLPVDYYLVCLYNLSGYRGKREDEPHEVFDDNDRRHGLAVLVQLERPCLAYKVLAAGRKTLKEGLGDVAAVLRKTDGVVLGMFPPDVPDIVPTNVATFCSIMSRHESGQEP